MKPRVAVSQAGVYAMACGQYIKIGSTNNVRGRLQTIQTANPEVVTLRWFAPMSPARALRCERTLQALFRRRRVRLEWFCLDPIGRWQLEAYFALIGDPCALIRPAPLEPPAPRVSREDRQIQRIVQAAIVRKAAGYPD